MISWMAGILYLPRLYVYHAQATDKISMDRFKIMERKLFFGIMTPSAILTLVSGAWLWLGYGFSGIWLNIKLVLAALLVLHHIGCYRALVAFKKDVNTRSHVFYRWMNELPVLLLFGIVVLVVVKPV